LGFLYFFYTCRVGFLQHLCTPIFTLAAFLFPQWRWIVSAGVIAGVVLVFLLIGYLIYALINAEAF